MGDYLIGNQKIRVVLQNQGWSRGFGIFGGGIIDADIVRPGTQGILDAAMVRIISVSSSRRSSYKLLTLRRDVNEMRTDLIRIPAIEVLNDGTDGEPALIRTRARAETLLPLHPLSGKKLRKMQPPSSLNRLPY